MTIEQTQRTMDDYFHAMGVGAFLQFFGDEVTWTTIESGDQVRGPARVQEAITGLHSVMTDVQARRLVVSDGAAYIEGDCAGPEPDRRISFCVAYDLTEDRITAMRAYGALAAMMP